MIKIPDSFIKSVMSWPPEHSSITCVNVVSDLILHVCKDPQRAIRSVNGDFFEDCGVFSIVGEEEDAEEGDIAFLEGKSFKMSPHCGILIKGGKGLLHYTKGYGSRWQSYDLFLRSSWYRERAMFRIKDDLIKDVYKQTGEP